MSRGQNFTSSSPHLPNNLRTKFSFLFFSSPSAHIYKTNFLSAWVGKKKYLEGPLFFSLLTGVLLYLQMLLFSLFFSSLLSSSDRLKTHAWANLKKKWGGGKFSFLPGQIERNSCLPTWFFFSPNPPHPSAKQCCQVLVITKCQIPGQIMPDF